MGVIFRVFLRLDEDLSYEVLIEGEDKEVEEYRFKVVILGVCVLVVYVKGIEFIVVNCGDCRVVFGV